MSETPTEQAAEGWSPVILTVAPNGARKGKRDHSALPITPDEIADCAAACAHAGAAMIHLHVRDGEGRHTLDADAYRAALEAVAREVGDRIIVQVTSEAVGRYEPDQQMAMVRALHPEAVSVAVREMVPDATYEEAAADFFTWLHREAILPQYILYSDADLARFDDLIARGIIPPGPHFVLFVLGRYTAGQQSHPLDLVPFVSANNAGHIWAACAFGVRETACAVTAAALGGHVRVGFENNMTMPDGTRAADNAALVRATAAGICAIGRPLATVEQARDLLRRAAVRRH